ncbi:MAG: hypothetical protein U0893_05355 [Chloroflexota bacterium]
MEIVEALVRAVKLYLVVGLVAAAINAVGFHRPGGDNRYQRTVSVAEDVVLWPHFLVDVAGAVDGRLATLPSEDRPILYTLLRQSLAGGGPSRDLDVP